MTLHFRYPLYNASWTGDTFVTYNAQPYCGLLASYVDDNNTTMGTFLVYTNGTETITSPNCPVNAGTYTVTARPMNPIDSLLGATTTLTILPATVSVSGAEVETAKFYDGTVDATVINRGTLNGVQGNDNLTYTTTAWYSQAEVGTNLTVSLGYTIDGTAATNYVLDPVESIYSTNGAILAPFETDSTIVTGDTLDGSQDGIIVDADGYCVGTGMIGFRLTSGSPDQYKLVFSDAVFTDVDWRFLDTPEGNNGVIYFDVPGDIAMGDYNVTIYFRQHEYPTLVSNPVTVSFHINLPETYIVPLFNDVIALIDTCHCITDVQWYRRSVGETVWTLISGANGFYYYQEDGLEGWEFTVRCKFNGQETFICPQTDMQTLVSDDPTTVTVFPNPTTGDVTIRIDNAVTIEHSIVLLNMMGVQMEQRTFSGSSVNLDLSGYQRGSYIVSVDGIVVRVIRN
ncbi:MAG: T9SS type A sorting domain-containing protein [Prevotella sp.]|nr:T9SS type A sorting domain-containing protein [Prevotella sp.]